VRGHGSRCHLQPIPALRNAGVRAMVVLSDCGSRAVEAGRNL
jgi:hypothetical protein